jgi:hypothetical protein
VTLQAVSPDQGSIAITARAATQRIDQTDVPGRCGTKRGHRNADDAGASSFVSHVSCLVAQRAKAPGKEAKLSICSLAHYQFEMLMPHCRHDFVESYRRSTLLASTGCDT